MKASKRKWILIGLSIGLSAGLRAAGTVQWSFRTGGGVYATPLVLDGVVYIGSHDSVFYALDAQTGAERWRFRSGNQIFSSAATDGNIVCFQSDNKLFGLDLNGSLKWQAPLAAGRVLNQHDQYDISSSSPRIVEGVAYVGSEAGQVFGIRLTDGAVVFHVKVEPADVTVETTPVVDNGKIYFGTFNGVMYAYDLSTGLKVWAYDTRMDYDFYPNWVNAIESEAVVWNGALYFAGRSSTLYSLNPETGARNWLYHDGGDFWLRGGPVIQDSTLYIGSSLQSCIHAFDPLTGGLKWKQAVDFVVYGRPSVDGDFVFFGTSDETSGLDVGSLYAVDRLTGRPKNRIRFDGHVFSTPVNVNGTLVIGCVDGNVYGLDRQAVLDNPLPVTGFQDKSRITVGELPRNGETRGIPVAIVNTGEGPDSVFVRLNAPSSLTENGALSLDADDFVLAAGESRTVMLDIHPSLIQPGNYRATLVLNTKYSLDFKQQTKSIGFTIVAPSGVETGDLEAPAAFSVGPNYPNPFNPATTIEYAVARDGDVRLSVHNLAGEEVAVLADGFTRAGAHQAVFDASGLAGGIYLYRVRAGGREIVRKMSLLK